MSAIALNRFGPLADAWRSDLGPMEAPDAARPWVL